MGTAELKTQCSSNIQQFQLTALNQYVLFKLYIFPFRKPNYCFALTMTVYCSLLWWMKDSPNNATNKHNMCSIKGVLNLGIFCGTHHYFLFDMKVNWHSNLGSCQLFYLPGLLNIREQTFDLSTANFTSPDIINLRKPFLHDKIRSGWQKQ